jgi:SNF2 family DNA or RNA helicase
MNLCAGDRVFIFQFNEYGVFTGVTIPMGSQIMYQIKRDTGFCTAFRESGFQLATQVPDPNQSFERGIFADYEKFRQFLTHLRIKGSLTNIVYSMKYGDVEFFPYQFKPVFKFISSTENRLLIADEVGLGKTIEALYVWKELQVREGANRLLVVAPAMLCGKWRYDMECHFGIDAQILKGKDLLDLLKRARDNSKKPFAVITSLQGIRQRVTEENKLKKGNADSARFKINRLFEDFEQDYVEKSKDPRQFFDMVIFDEAHYLTNPKTSNFATAKRINEITKSLLLLSATPISNSQMELYSLLRLLNPGEYGDENFFKRTLEENKDVVKLASCFYRAPSDLNSVEKDARALLDRILVSEFFKYNSFFSEVKKRLPESLSDNKLRIETYHKLTESYFYSDVFTRSKKRDVQEASVRSAQTVSFELSAKEMEVYSICSAELADKYREDHEDQLFVFGIMARQREMASSIPAAIQRWKSLETSSEEDDDYMNQSEKENTDHIDYRSTLPDLCLDMTDEEISDLAKNDTKFNAFLLAVKDKLGEAREAGEAEKIIVFSFFRNTLDYLSKRLSEEGIGHRLIKGGLKQEIKDQGLLDFKEKPDICILLSSEVGAEGLDMQFAHIEFNYDLPWNPMKLEQRIGRIDRIGQLSKKIMIVNMTCQSTIEDRVLEKLYNKIEIFKNSIGELDEILGDMTMEIEMSLLSKELSPKQLEEEASKKIDRYNTQLINIKRLEEASGLSKAFNDSIIEYITSTEKNSRFIKAEDLTNYISDFFSINGMGTRFYQDERRPELWNLELSDQDRSVFQDYLAEKGLAFNANSKLIKCTFPQGKKSGNYIDIDITHPLVKWIHTKTDGDMKEKNGNHCYVLGINKGNGIDLKCGAYAFFIGELETSGYFKRNELVATVCSMDGVLLDQAIDGENLINRALFTGYPINDLNLKMSCITKDCLMSAKQKCIDQARAWFNADVIEEDARNNATYEQKMLNAKKNYEHAIASTLQAIETLRKNKKFNYIILQEGILKKEERKNKNVIEEIEKRKKLEVRYEELALGLIFIEP